MTIMGDSRPDIFSYSRGVVVHANHTGLPKMRKALSGTRRVRREKGKVPVLPGGSTSADARRSCVGRCANRASSPSSTGTDSGRLVASNLAAHSSTTRFSSSTRGGNSCRLGRAPNVPSSTTAGRRPAPRVGFGAVLSANVQSRRA